MEIHFNLNVTTHTKLGRGIHRRMIFRWLTLSLTVYVRLGVQPMVLIELFDNSS